MRPKDSRTDPQESYVIDSCGWIEFFSNGDAADEYAAYIEKANRREYFTPSIIFYEVYKKIRTAYSEEEALRAVAHIKYATTIIDFSEEIAISAAEMSIREKLPMADAIIAATAKRKGAKIVTSDEHFKDNEHVIFIEK
ncbi:MAG: type II toxin-antitoxin system VapC family toxin [Thermoplasmata archaeon]|nr:type II toxin-antitoxin system VapC family toxin [Thermoplasmata archaeon]